MPRSQNFLTLSTRRFVLLLSSGGGLTVQNMKSSFLIFKSYTLFLVFLKRGIRIFLFKSNLKLLKMTTHTKYDAKWEDNYQKIVASLFLLLNRCNTLTANQHGYFFFFSGCCIYPVHGWPINFNGLLDSHLMVQWI